MIESKAGKTWRITKTANWLKLLVFTIASIAGVHITILQMTDYNWDLYGVMMLGFLIGSPAVLLAWLTVFPGAILKRQVPQSISIAPDLTLTILYPKGKTKELPLERYAYTYHRYANYGVLILYQKDIATRGHIIQREFLILTGLRYGSGWNLKKLDEIAEYLTKNEVRYVIAEDKKFLNRIVD